jgi:hypothetical protein
MGFIDPSPHRTMPGWPLRNLLTLLSIRFGVKEIRVLCWKKEAGGGQDLSVVVDLRTAKEDNQGAQVSSSSGSEYDFDRVVVVV